MGRQREPISLLEAKNRSHMTKAEKESRRAREVSPIADDMTPPAYLTKTQAAQFARLVYQLDKLGIIGETDVEALARYVAAQSLYEQATQKLRAALRATDDVEVIDPLSRLQDRCFRQADTAARALGLTISSRAKLVAPVADEPEKENKFARFGGDAP